MDRTDTRPGDLLLRDAPLYRDGRWDGDCLVVRDGRIAGLGSHDEVAHLVGPGTRVESLAGRWLLPAFHDAHVHPVQAGTELNLCNLTDLGTIEEYVERIASYAAAHPDRPWVTGGGWSMDAFPGGVPTADLLDRACPDRPAFLPNRDHHSAWVNTRALELAGIDAHTPDPADGRIERGPDGRPTGALHEGAMDLVGRPRAEGDRGGADGRADDRAAAPALDRHRRLAGRPGRRRPRHARHPGHLPRRAGGPAG